MIKQYVYSYVIILLITLLLILPQIHGMDYPKWFTPGTYIEYKVYGFFSSDPPYNNISRYIVIGVIRYTFKDIVNDTVRAVYSVLDLNDTLGLFRMIGYKGLNVDANISLRNRFNGSKMTIIVDPNSLHNSGFVSYTNISVKDSMIHRLRVDGFYDPTTGILVNYTAINDINDTKTGRKMIYKITYRLEDSSINELKKYLATHFENNQTINPTTNTTTTNRESRIEENVEKHDETMMLFIILVLSIVFFAGLAIYNFLKKK